MRQKYFEIKAKQREAHAKLNELRDRNAPAHQLKKCVLNVIRFHMTLSNTLRELDEKYKKGIASHSELAWQGMTSVLSITI